ncbi:MAG: glycosyltransferase family 2 protein [Bacteroidetes bacterium]|nr:glycosyltransferase family 2 protein [Bacteroidota bacterium]
MNNSPFFSIVIPTYNRAGFIRKTIDSALSQSFQNFEVIVVDDGSTDNTEEVVRSIDAQKIHYYKKQNGERAAARNFGAVLSKGQFINFVDSDDLLHPNHLDVATQFIEKNKTADVFHLGYEIKNDIGKLRAINNIRSVNDEIVNGNRLSCNGVFIRREVLLKNPFNEDRALSSLEDWELWIRLSARYPFLNDNSITSTIVQHDSRSVMTADTSKIKTKVDRFVHYVINDEQNRKYYGQRLNKAVASAFTYASLHLAMANESKREVFHYLWKGVKTYPGEILKKRFLVIMKKLISH